MALADQIRERWIEKLRKADVDPKLREALENVLAEHADSIDRGALVAALEAALAPT